MSSTTGTGEEPVGPPNDDPDDPKYRWALCPPVFSFNRIYSSRSIYEEFNRVQFVEEPPPEGQGTEILPLKRLSDYTGNVFAGPWFRDSFPPDAAGDQSKTDIHVLKLSAILGERQLEPGGYLRTDWKFDSIEAEAKRHPYHVLEGRKVGNILEWLVGSVCELEDALRRAHPSLPTSAVPAFWTCWQVQLHIAAFCQQLAQFRDRLAVEKAREALGQHLAAYSRGVEDTLRSSPGEAPPSPPVPPASSTPGDDLEHLIKGKDSVTLEHAAKYLGVTKRHINNLTRKGQLKVVGKGQHRRITVKSLRCYKGTSAPADCEEESQT